MTVDIGQPPVLDGTTGGILETTVDGAEARVNTEQLVLIDVSLEELAHSLVVIDRRLANATDELDDAKANVKALKKDREALLSQIKDRDAGVAPLPFEPEGDDGEAEVEL